MGRPDYAPPREIWKQIQEQLDARPEVERVEHGRRIDLADAVQHVGYRPAVADGVPPTYTLDSALF